MSYKAQHVFQKIAVSFGVTRSALRALKKAGINYTRDASVAFDNAQHLVKDNKSVTTALFSPSKILVFVGKSATSPTNTLLHEIGHAFSTGKADKQVRRAFSDYKRGRIWGHQFTDLLNRKALQIEYNANKKAKKLIKKYSSNPQKDLKDFSNRVNQDIKTYQENSILDLLPLKGLIAQAHAVNPKRYEALVDLRKSLKGSHDIEGQFWAARHIRNMSPEFKKAYSDAYYKNKARFHRDGFGNLKRE